MFTAYEALQCESCRAAFLGRKPAEGGSVLCPECLEAGEIPVIDDPEAIPPQVLAEIKNGRGKDE